MKKAGFEKSLAYREGFTFVAQVPDFLKKLVHDEGLEGKTDMIDVEFSHLSKEERHQKLLSLKSATTIKQKTDDGSEEDEICKKEDEKPQLVNAEDLYSYLNEDELIEIERAKLQNEHFQKKLDREKLDSSQNLASLEKEFKPKFIKPGKRRIDKNDQHELSSVQSFHDIKQKKLSTIKKSSQLLSFNDEEEI